MSVEKYGQTDTTENKSVQHNKEISWTPARARYKREGSQSRSSQRGPRADHVTRDNASDVASRMWHLGERKNGDPAHIHPHTHTHTHTHTLPQIIPHAHISTADFAITWPKRRSRNRQLFSKSAVFSDVRTISAIFWKNFAIHFANIFCISEQITMAVRKSR